MKVIVMDLELNQPSNKIIQIGAVACKINSQESTIIGSFDKIVNPGEALDPFIIDLTDITQENVDDPDSKDLGVTYDEFQLWVDGINPQLLIAWGNDWEWLYKEANKPMSQKAVNLKQMYLLLNAYKTNNKQARGLRAAVEELGLGFKGRQHNAQIDAFNTAALLFEIVKRYRLFNEFREKVQE